MDLKTNLHNKILGAMNYRTPDDVDGMIDAIGDFVIDLIDRNEHGPMAIREHQTARLSVLKAGRSDRVLVTYGKDLMEITKAWTLLTTDGISWWFADNSGLLYTCCPLESKAHNQVTFNEIKYYFDAKNVQKL